MTSDSAGIPTKVTIYKPDGASEWAFPSTADAVEFAEEHMANTPQTKTELNITQL